MKKLYICGCQGPKYDTVNLADTHRDFRIYFNGDEVGSKRCVIKRKDREGWRKDISAKYPLPHVCFDMKTWIDEGINEGGAWYDADKDDVFRKSKIKDSRSAINGGHAIESLKKYLESACKLKDDEDLIWEEI